MASENIKEAVLTLLRKYPELRDDRDKLIRIILAKWRPQGTQTAEQYAANNFTLMATIDRRWRKTQQEHPELRGKEWVDRQTVKVDNVRKDLGYSPRG